jgi:hypothetical protein
MSTGEQIPEAEVVEEHGTEVMPKAGTALAVAAPVQASDLVERMGKIREAMERAMEKDVDYGVIPGTQKPTLLKPGAEKLAVMFKLDVQITHDERWGPGDHLTVPAYAVVYDAPTGVRLGRGEGLCSTRERKYAYRKQERTCPQCGAAAVIKGKAEFGGGWLCWKKRDGCGAKFPDGDQAIEGQEVGDIENPDLPDLWNTVIKMARKRALTDAVLLVTGASALFTQDVEEAVSTPEPSAAVEPYGAVAQEGLIKQVVTAIGFLCGCSENDPPVKEVLGKVNKDARGYLPWVALRAIGHAAGVALEERKAREAASRAMPDPALDAAAGEFTRDPDAERAETIAAEHGGVVGDA